MRGELGAACAWAKITQINYMLAPLAGVLVLLMPGSSSCLPQGATRDKKTRTKAMSIVNPNFPPEKLAKHMSAELGWGIDAMLTIARSLLRSSPVCAVRVRSGREDVFATAVKQVGLDRFMLCFSSKRVARGLTTNPC